jgi:hypothetical protein
MQITKETHLFNIQLRFQEKFPLLKIEFFKSVHEKLQLSPLSDEVMTDLTVGEFNPELKEGEFLLDESETTGDFENRMEQSFGLHVQVYRKSGINWLQTSNTDLWTLGKQESMAHS